MTRHKQSECKAGLSPTWLALGVCTVFSLSACTTSGISDFAEGVTPQEAETASGMTEIPLEIASGENIAPSAREEISPQGEPVDLSRQQVAGSDETPAADDTLPVFDGNLAATAEPPADPLTTASLDEGDQASALVDPDQPLSPQVASLRAETDARFAALTQGTAPVPTDDELAATYPGMSDPEEIAAQQRIGPLQASFEHGQCKGGWGPKPKMINAKRMTPGHPYYMEMRLRHTPMLPVGHVYIAYGDLSADGEPLNEKLIMLAPIGGYVGAGIAGTIPMPGLLSPHPQDCTVTPEAGYRVSLSAQNYERLLTAIYEAKQSTPSYHLLAYNCNHFMSDIAKSVGILPPANIYKPSLIYFYEMVDRNEGRKVPRTPSNMSIAAANRASLRQ